MKIIKAIKLDKYNNYKRYIQYGDFIYKDKKSRNNPVYCITLYTELKDDEDGQYPLEDILDEYYVNCTEVMEEIEEDKKRIFIFEIEGEDINSIKSIAELIGKRVYNIEENGYVKLKIE